MLTITASGSPYEIGLQHGREAKSLVHGSLQFYAEYFERLSKLSWSEATSRAENFMPFLEKHASHLVEEMKGLAEGAGVTFQDILVLNARSEISMGLMNDGCTTFGWKTDRFSIAGQNWDWEDAQKERLILLHILPNPEVSIQGPVISQITEAGILGKIGINSHGVGVFLNAIRSPGVNYSAIPIHLALRMAMESSSRLKAVARLRSLGGGTAAHIMIADGTGATSLEFSAYDVEQLEMATIFNCTHERMKRMQKILGHEAGKLPSEADAKVAFGIGERLLEDEEGFPLSINRKSSSNNGASTLFSIVADLESKKAIVRVGRPTECDEILILDCSQV